jgi:hypothetical protein
MSSIHTLSLHRPTSNSSSTTNFPWLSPTENWTCSPNCLQENSSARIPRKTPSSVVKDACLQLHCLAVDVLLFRAFASAGTCLPTSCLTVGIYATVLSTHLSLGLLVVSFFLTFPPIFYIHSSSPHSCYMPCQSRPHWLDNSYYTWRSVQLMKLLLMPLSPTSSHSSVFSVQIFSSAPCS